MLGDPGKELSIPAIELAVFEAHAAKLTDMDALKRLHLHSDTGMFLDWGNHTEDVALVKQSPEVC